MKSLKARFDGNCQAVVEYAGKFGIHKAMDKFGVRDYLAMRRFLYGETGEENFGIRSQLSGLSGSGGRNILDQFLEKFADYVVRKQAQLKTKDERIEFLERKLEYYEGKDTGAVEEELTSIMEVLE